MQRLWIGGYGTCSSHNEKYVINRIAENSKKFEIVKDYKEADIIVIIDTCLGLERMIHESFQYIKKVIEEKRENATVIVSGCLVKGLKYELSEEQKNILKNVQVIDPEEIIIYIARMIKNSVPQAQLENFKTPYTIEEYGIRFSPSIGCMNHCSFCKSNYMNFQLQSNPFEHIEKLVKMIEETKYPLHYATIFSSNVSLYGIDLYGRQRSHEVIKKLTEPNKIKFAKVGAIINWYPELLEEILNNPKIKEIFVSIESGSPRIYQLMNRPIPLKKLIEIIRLIKRNRPDIVIDTEFIIGFPTETIEDLKMTIELAQKLGVCPRDLHPYENSPHIPSSKLDQHSLKYCIESSCYAYGKLLELHNTFVDRIKNGEMFVVEKYEYLRCYSMLLIDGTSRIVGYKQLDREYQIGEIVPANSVKIKQLIK